MKIEYKFIARTWYIATKAMAEGDGGGGKEGAQHGACARSLTAHTLAQYLIF